MPSPSYCQLKGASAFGPICGPPSQGLVYCFSLKNPQLYSTPLVPLLLTNLLRSSFPSPVDTLQFFQFLLHYLELSSGLRELQVQQQTVRKEDILGCVQVCSSPAHW